MVKYRFGYYFDEFTKLFKSIGINSALHYEHNDVFEFYNELNNIRYSIFTEIGWGENGFWIGNVSSSIAFHDVNEILKNYIPTYPFRDPEPTLTNGYIRNIRAQLMDADFKRYLLSSVEIKSLKEKLGEHTQKHIRPFFSLFPNLQAIETEIYNKLSYDEYPNFFPGNCTFKNLIIMRMLKNEKLTDYINYKDEEYRNYVQQNQNMWQSPYEEFKTLVRDLQIH